MKASTRIQTLSALLLFGAELCGQTLKQTASIDLPGPEDKRFDYLTVDYDDQYLLSAHLAAGLLYVIDMRTNRLVKAIRGVPGVEGVEFVPHLKKAYTSDSGDNKPWKPALAEAIEWYTHSKCRMRVHSGTLCHETGLMLGWRRFTAPRHRRQRSAESLHPRS